MPEQGPFSDVLNGPLIGRTEPQIQPQSQQIRPSGFMGKAGGIAMFADKFLEGLSKGRLAAFQKSEIAQAKEVKSVDSSIQQVQESIQQGITDPQAGQAEIQRLNNIKNGIVLGVLDRDGADGGKKKGKTDTPPGGKKSGGKTDGQGNPVMGALKSVFEKIAGPGAQPMAYSPGAVYAEVGKTQAFLQDQKNTVTQRMKDADLPLLEAYHAAAQAHPDKAPTWDEIRSNDAFTKAWSNAANVASTVRKEMTPTQALIKQELDRATQEQSPDAIAKREESRARAQKETAEASSATTRAEALKTGKIVDYVNGKGEVLNRVGDQYFVPGGTEPLKEGDSRLVGVRPWQKTPKPVFAPGVQKDGTRLMWNQEKNDWEPLKDASGKVARFDTPAGLQAMRESGMETRQAAAFAHGDKDKTKKMLESYDSLISSVKKAGNMKPADQDAEVKRLQNEKKDVENQLKDMDEAGSPKPNAKTDTPPKAKSTSSNSTKNMDDKVRKLAEKHNLLPSSQSSTSPPPSQ